MANCQLDGPGPIDVLGDGRLIKQIIRSANDENRRPQEGEKVFIHYTCRLGSDSGSIIDSSREGGDPFIFTLGAKEVIAGLDHGVATMQGGELATFMVHPELAYGVAGCGGGVVPAMHPGGDVHPSAATLHYEIELQGIDTSTAAENDDVEVTEHSPEERLDIAMRSKDLGNTHFKASKLDQALSAYNRALHMLGLSLPKENAESTLNDSKPEDDPAWSDEMRKEARGKIGLACHLNAAQCCLKLDRAPEAFKHSSAALDIDAASAKAYYRRGCAAMVLGLFDRARSDLADAVRRDPKNAEIRAQLQACQEQSRAADAQARGTFGGMFERGNKR